MNKITNLILDFLFSQEIKNYGMSKLLASWCKWPNYLPFRFNIHHGWYAAEEPRKSDLNSKSHVMLVFNRRQEKIWNKNSKKKCFVVSSPFIQYRKQNNVLKKKDAKGTLAFPHHNGTQVKTEFNFENYCKELKKLPNSFHPIDICLHIDDLGTVRENIFKENGFKIYCCGERDNINYAKNFYSLLCNYKYSTSNAIATSTLYSVEMNIPFFLYGPESKMYDTSNMTIRPNRPLAEEAKKLFLYKTSDFKITPEQKKFVSDELALDSHISPEVLKKELMRIFFIKSIPFAMVRLIFLPFFVLTYSIKILKRKFRWSIVRR